MVDESKQIPEYIGVYKVMERIAEGGFGVVYRGIDPRLKREVAIKVLHPQHSSDPTRIARFLREAQSAARLNCPGIVQIYDIVEENHQFALVMEYVHGKSLDKFLKEHPQLSLLERMELAIQIAEALYVAHGAGIVHRDIKPANILVDDNRVVKLTDFNLARLRDVSLTPLTGDHHVLGTPAYMSPEQCLGKEATPKSDIYSFGVVMYFMFTGTLPFEGDNYLALMRQHAETPPTPVRLINPDLPVALERLISSCLSKNPEHRPEHCLEIADRLREIRGDLLKRVTPDEALIQPTLVLGEETTPNLASPTSGKTPLYPLTPPGLIQEFHGIKAKSEQVGELGASTVQQPLSGRGLTPEGLTPVRNELQPTVSERNLGQDIHATSQSIPCDVVSNVAEPIDLSLGQEHVDHHPISQISGTVSGTLREGVSRTIAHHEEMGEPKRKIPYVVLAIVLIGFSVSSFLMSAYLTYRMYFKPVEQGDNRNSERTTSKDSSGKILDYDQALSIYAHSYDSNYKYDLVTQWEGEGYRAYSLELTSQSWHPEKTVPPVWRHWLTLIVPTHWVKDVGMLVITEGLSRVDSPMSEIPPFLVSLAIASKTVVGIVEGFPRDPLGFYETPVKVVHLRGEEFMVWSIQQFFITGDASWLVFCPMVKSVIRAMDAVQEFLLKNLRSEIPVREFVLCGDAPYYTVWLVPAVDTRVKGLISINSTAISLEQSLKRLLIDGIEYPSLFAEMDDSGVIGQLETDEGIKLLRIIDPRSYKETLRLPKLVIALGGDHPSDLVLYAKSAIEEVPLPVSYVLFPHIRLSRENIFLPQQMVIDSQSPIPQKIYDFRDTIQVFFQRFLGQRNMPNFRWEIHTNGECMVEVDDELVECRVWYCSAEQRGELFKSGNTWFVKGMKGITSRVYKTTISVPEDKYTAVFIEVVFPSLLGVNFPMTSPIEIIAPVVEVQIENS